MKLRSIAMTNLRRFAETVRIDGIGDGLNVLCEPNEHGKSTVFDAIQAVIFKPHGSRDKEVMALRPHAGGAPEVSLDIETEAGQFTLFKRWLQKPVAQVHRGGQLIAQSDAAEAWIGDLLGAEAGGPSGLIWVRQGLTDFTEPNAKAQKAALEARRDLMSTVGEEVDAMTGGRRMDQALARCRAELDHYATGRNRSPRKGGPWKAAQDAVAQLSEQRAALQATADALHEALAERSRARRALTEWEAPDALRDRQTRLDTARRAHADAERHAESVATAARAVEMARLQAEAAQARLDQFRAAAAEQAEAQASAAEARRAAALADNRQAEARAARTEADSAFEAARAALAKAQDQLARALRAEAARDGADRRRALQDRIAEAEATRRRMESAQAAARSGPDGATLQRLEQLNAALVSARASRDAEAPRVVMHYVAGRSGGVTLDGVPLPEGEARALPRDARLALEGLGTLAIHPPRTGQTEAAVDRARAALDAALAALNLPSIADARAAAADRREAEQRFGEARAVLASLAPEGLEALHATLAAIPLPDADAEALAPDAARAALASAQDDHETARHARELAATRHAEARSEQARTGAVLQAQADRLARATEAMARFDGATEATLDAACQDARASLQAATATHAERAASAPDLAATQAALNRAESVDRRARDEIARLKPLLAALDERIAHASGDAVEERLAETGQALEAAEADLDRLTHEVLVLTRLEAALEAARTDARERYFMPVANELRPLLHLLWPEAQLTWAEDTLLPDALVRNGVPEPIDVLSGGTQEQLALLVRLAFARMLAKSGRVVPVILDDALVYTDDDRIERMFDALHRQAGNMQILVLTCRQRVFRDLGGHALRLVSTRAPDGPAGSGGHG